MKDIEKNWLVMPDQVTAKIREWQALCPDSIAVRSIRQYAGTDAFAVTFTAPGDSAGRGHHFSGVPHAHEPGATAGAMDVLNALATGYHLDGREWALDRDEVLERCVVSIIPDGNPDGRSRAPVRWWDGTLGDNDLLHCTMRGRDRATGEMWKRLGLWSTEEETDHPDPVGIVYEQLNAVEYAEPNRTARSSYWRLLEQIRAIQPLDQSVPLHQCGFEGLDYKAVILLPVLQDELPPEIQSRNTALSDAIVAAWREAGAGPVPPGKPLTYTGQQRQYFVDLWGDFYQGTAAATSEVENNNPRTPPADQMRFSEIAVTAALQHLMDA